MARYTAMAVLFGWLAMTVPALATTYYIRADGGTAVQCNGLSDAPYPGSGTGRACAWAHPYWALYATDPPRWRISGGDTLVIDPGEYMLGYGAPNTGWCDREASYDCQLPPLPSGPDAAHPTRIVGRDWQSGCQRAPQLWGTERIWHVLDLTATSNVVVACLEITDHSSCVEFHAAPGVRCRRDSPPYGPWASAGLHAEDSGNVLLQDLNIHGLASAGIEAGRIHDWTIERVRLAANGWVGWEGDLGGPSSNSGALTFRHWLVEWNGCAEDYPLLTPAHCWAQPVGGYGDGVGTAATGGRWVVEDSTFRYNTSDGLDLLYVREPGASIVIRRCRAYGNAGNQIKTMGNARIENVFLNGNCGYFYNNPIAPPIGSTDPIDHCRAGGAAWDFSLTPGSHVSLVNATVVGEGDCLVAGTCQDGGGGCNGAETIEIYNSIFQGFAEFMDGGDQACYLWLDRNDLYTLSWDYNIVFDAKIGDGLPPLGHHDLNSDPLLVYAPLHYPISLNDIQGRVQADSPALDSALPPGSLGGLVPARDLDGTLRPQGPGNDRGAYEMVPTGASQADSGCVSAPSLRSSSAAFQARAGSARSSVNSH